MAQSKNQNFLHGAAILTAGVVIMKILGAIYKIPLGNILGDDGYSYFYSAYSVYNVFLTLATAGIPVALSRMIAEANTQHRPNQVRRIFRVTWWTLLCIGFVCSLAMAAFPAQFAGIIHRPEARLSIVAIAPAVLLVCVMSAYRGYCQGKENMTPTTVGQVLEVLVKVAVGLALAAVLVKSGKNANMGEYGSAGAIFGVSVGALAALIYMVWYKRKYYREEERVAADDVPDSGLAILKRLFIIGIPITIGACGMSFISFIDTMLVNTRLQTAAGFSLEESAVLFGVFGKAQTLYNLPAAFITPLTISVVPAIAASMVKKDYIGTGKVAETALRIAMVLALPMGIGLAVLSTPIMNVVYPSSHASGGMLLLLMGIASVFVCFALIENAILQAHGNERLTIVSMLAGGIVKIIVNYTLVGNPEINIIGAPIGTLLCYVVICSMNFWFIRRCMEVKPSLSRAVLRPLVSSAIMGVCAWAVYGICHRVLGSALLKLSAARGEWLGTAVSMVIAIGIAAIVYLVVVIATRSVTAEDMKLIPKGEKLAKLLRIK